MKRVLIIILNYKTYDMTIDLIKKLKQLDESLFDIYVVDNCSPNESADVLSEASGEMRFIFHKNERNSGYAAGNNIGIRYAIEKEYDYSLIMNNDLEIIDPQFIEKMVRSADSNEHIACVGPKILDINHNPVPPYCERPTFYTMTLGIALEKKKRRQFIDTPRQVYRVFGCCMLLKNSAMKAVDCMDERTFLYCEEEILAERLLRIGSIAYYNPEALMVHMESITVNQEHSGKNIRKIKILLNSMGLYLREYRHFNRIAVKLCQVCRFLIMYFRG